MSQLFTIQDDKIVINKLALKYLEGSVTHAGQLSVTGNVTLSSNLFVGGTITADTIKVTNLITESGTPLGESGHWTTDSEDKLVGKGFSWNYNDTVTSLAYRSGNRLWTNANIELAENSTYKINDIDVLSSTSLGPTVKQSRLREVGTLKSLEVEGKVSIGEYAFFNENSRRIGINTDQPNAAIGIIENDVEIVVGSLRAGQATIGSFTNHDVAIVTDNTARITVKNSGEVLIGDPVGKNGVLYVYGNLYAENIVSDTRIERSSPLEFKATRDSSIYGKGLVWSGTGSTRQFIMMGDPDRLQSSESLELAKDKSYHIDGVSVLSYAALGESVVSSNLTSVGELTALTVAGNVNVSGQLSSVESTTKLLTVEENSQSLRLTATGVVANRDILITVNNSEVVYASADEISIGNRQHTRRPVKVYGPLSVGITTPEDGVDLSVKGDIKFADKKFTTGTGAPTGGNYSKGDICWNQDPKESSYIGWVCVVPGAPGTWLPFGSIGRP